MRANCAQFGIPLHRLGDPGQGIVHVISPELGLARPGMTIVCCDSHTTTLGAFGAIAFGIGTAQVEHVLATQTLVMRRLKDMAVTVTGRLPAGVTAKDLALAFIAKVGTAGGQGHIIEYRGEAIEALSMEARMTLCNMSVEAGSIAGLVAPDDTTFAYLKTRPGMPRGRRLGLPRSRTGRACAATTTRSSTSTSRSTPARSARTCRGAPTRPRASRSTARVPAPADFDDPQERAATERALRYMDLRPGTALRDVAIDTVFLGSCTNSRIEDLRAAAEVLPGGASPTALEMIVVPGSMAGPPRRPWPRASTGSSPSAGADFRAAAGCSMCAALNEDRLRPGQRAASTNNRNFEGRQGKDPRTHIVSPPSPPRPRSPADSPHPRTSLRRKKCSSSLSTAATRCRCDAPTSTPTRSSRPASVPYFQPRRATPTRCSPTGARPQRSCSTCPQYGGATVLVAGNDFGTGSSRESAVWAIAGGRFPRRARAALRRHLPPDLADEGPAHRRRPDIAVVERLWDLIASDPPCRDHRRPRTVRSPLRRPVQPFDARRGRARAPAGRRDPIDLR